MDDCHFGYITKLENIIIIFRKSIPFLELLLILLLSWTLIVYYDIVVLVVKLFTLKGAIINWRVCQHLKFHIFTPKETNSFQHLNDYLMMKLTLV